MVSSGRQWVGLVHPEAQASREAFARHLWFVATRLALGAGALASVPLLLAVHGAIAPATVFTVALLAAQALSGVYCARTGRLGDAYRASLASLTLLAVLLSLFSPEGGAALLGVLPFLIVEAALIAGPPAFWLAVATACLVPAVFLPGLFGGAAPGGISDALFGGAVVGQVGKTAAALGLGLLVMREVRQRHSRERQLAIQGEIIARGFGDLVTRHDRQGLVVFAGPSAAAVLGVSPESLRGRGLFELVHVADRPCFLKALSDATQRDGIAHAQVRVRCPGEPAGDRARAAVPHFGWFEARIQLVSAGPEEGGEPDEIVCVLRDVSGQKRHEEEIEQARRQAVCASETKSGFLATVSHELRTPLNAIIGFSEMLSSDKLTPADDERRRDYARIIHLSGQHLLDVVNTLLDISRIDSGTLQLDPEPFAMDDVVAGAIAMMALKAEQAGLALSAAVEPGLPRITADRRATKQILLNLVSNGLKFTPPGGRVIVRVARDGDGLRLTVEDTGIGIKPDDVVRLGEPFFQAQSNYDRKYEGTGLGLSVVKGLVGLHGGSLAVESHVARGTKVSVRLPFSPEPQVRPCVTDALAGPHAGLPLRNDNTATMVKKRA